MTSAFIHGTAEIDEQVEIGFDTKIWYFSHVLKNSVVGRRCKHGDYPVSEDFAGRIFSIPMHPYLTKEDQLKVARCLIRNRDSK